MYSRWSFDKPASAAIIVSSAALVCWPTDATLASGWMRATMVWFVDRSVSTGSGCSDSTTSNGSGQRNASGSTPTMRTARPSICRLRPTAAGSAPKRVRQNSYPRITAAGPFGRSSSASKLRPAAIGRPRVLMKPASARRACATSAWSPNAMLALVTQPMIMPADATPGMRLSGA